MPVIFGIVELSTVNGIAHIVAVKCVDVQQTTNHKPTGFKHRIMFLGGGLKQFASRTRHQILSTHLD